jgi:MFS family permease
VSLARTVFGADADVVRDRDFQVLLLASVSSPLGTTVVSPVLDSLTGPLGVSGARVGLLMAAFTAPAIVAIPLVGALSDRVGRKPTLMAGLLVFGLAGLAVPLTTDFRVVLALRALQGVGYTGIAPVLIAATGDLFAGARDATAQGLRFTTVGVSMTLFPLVAGAVVAFGWRYPFALYAVAVATVPVVAVRFTEPSRPGRAGAGGRGGPRGEVADGDDAGAAEGDGDGRARASEAGPVRALVALLREPTTLATVLGRAVPSFLWFVFLTYVSIVVVRLLGGTAGAAGALVAVSSVASSVGGTQVGRLAAALERRWAQLGTLAAMSVGVGVVAVAPSLPVAAVGCVAVGAGFGPTLSLYRSTISGLADDETRGGLVSLSESVGRLGSTAAPLLVGAAVAATRPALGFDAAVRWAVVGAAGLALAVGTALALVGR